MQAKQELLQIRLQEIPKEQSSLLIFEEDLEDAVIRTGVNRLVEQHDGICGIFSGDEESGYKYIVGSKTKDCRELAARMRQTLQARGGGSPAMIQGFVSATRSQICDVLQSNINM